MPDTPASPYRTPTSSIQEPPPSRYGGSGTFSIGACVRQAWDAFRRNLGPFLGLGLLLFVSALALVVIVTIVSLVSPALAQPVAFAVVYLLGVPALMWGFVRFSLNAIDGRAEPSDLLSISQSFGSRIGRVLLVWLGVLAIQLPAVVPQLLAQASGRVDLAALSVVWTLVWTGTVSLRLGMAFYLLVDRDVASSAALRGSWELTRGQMLRLVLLLLVAFLISLAGLVPVGLLEIAILRLSGATNSVGWAIVGIAILVLASLPVFCITMLLMPAAYRQMVGRATAAPAA